ncbi:hypothetical protein CXB51_031774 [Gossypium anomalum]|uniref:Uncharacterized protein n=1 Tax=Gossypium anomalum TaxID=47600 RepID=A0A8J5YC95_9ROSI|nr:hypothetical protein CXB51_031774 [Gossypium anomalum]
MEFTSFCSAQEKSKREPSLKQNPSPPLNASPVRRLVYALFAAAHCLSRLWKAPPPQEKAADTPLRTNVNSDHYTLLTDKMVRPYAIKGKKRKNRGEKYDKEEQEHEEQVEEEEEEEKEPAKRAAIEKPTEEVEVKEEEEGGEAGTDELVGIPITPSDKKNNKNGVIFVLEKASLEVAKVGKSFQLLNSDDHANFLRKNNKNPADYRPDITHQALLSILDSPVNKAGRLQAVYVRTEKGVLFEVKPHVRIPRTYKRFSVQLLQKLNITAVGKREKLLRVIKNPVTNYFPVNSRKIGFSYSSDKLVKMRKYVDAVGDDVNLVFVVGAMAHGKIEVDYIDDFIANCVAKISRILISNPRIPFRLSLSAAMCIARITEALADKWSIL